jgi:protein gp37
MADNTKIEWTDATWNPVRARAIATGRTGWHCVHKSEGCRNCYAEQLNKVRFGTGFPYKPGHLGKDVELFLDEKILLQPLRWRRPRRIFVCSMTDLFADFVPDEWIDRMFAVMALAPQHTFQVLTKRPDRMRAYFARYDAAHDHNCADMVADAVASLLGREGAKGGARTEGHDFDWPLANVWLGVSVEDQAAADERREDFQATPAAVKFVSYEPALGPVDWTGWDFVQQIISGGESGRFARPTHPNWHRHTRDFCAPRGIAFFFKQWGEWAPIDALRLGGNGWATDGPVTDRRGNVRDWMSRYVTFKNDAGAIRVRGHTFTGHATDLVYRVGKKAAGRLLDGVEHNGMPS